MVNEFIADLMLVKVFKNRTQLGIHAATLVEQKINEILSVKDEVNMIFAAAPSQNEFLAELKMKALPWEKINAFHMDEYIGLPSTAPQLFSTFLRDALFGQVPFKHVYYLNGNAEDIEKEISDYEKLLQNNPVDIVCMGIGENGHIAFNDPPVADFNDPVFVKKVELEDACRMQQVNDGCFEKIDDVPTHAITLTVPALMCAKFAYVMVPGRQKANAVRDTVHQSITEAYPSTILRKHPHAVLFLDEDSASKLR